MTLKILGEFSLTAVPKPNTDGIFQISLGAENRKDVLSMETAKDETIDQFCLRIRSMLRALMNGEARSLPVNPPEEKKKELPWAAQKEAMKKLDARV